MTRRSVTTVVGWGALALSLALGACTSGGEPTASPARDELARPLAGPVDVEGALAEWKPWFEALLAETGVPGASYAVVFEDEVVAVGGLGVRDVATGDPVDEETVFQLASVSKPLGSTVVARLVGDGVIAWDDPIAPYAPQFALSDPWVTEHVTFADLYSHRSGLPEHVGDDLEDLGYSRAEIFARLREVPLAPFRASYAYTNFGMTLAGVTAAEVAGYSWEDASRELVYEPLGMTHTSSTFADYLAQPNRAIPHMRIDGEWVTGSQRQPDAQSPAGGASSNAVDMAQWIRLQLANGEYDGAQLVAADAIQATHTSHVVSGAARSPAQLAPMYGLGWIVGTDAQGGMRLSHSGAFLLGAATAVELAPAAQLGIVVLSNGSPIGVVEAASKTFLDLALHGESPDWFGVFEPVFAEMIDPTPEVDYTTPPPGARPSSPFPTYVGTYENPYFGLLEVVEADGGLALVLGPVGTQLPLTHYDGDEFATTLPGENAGPPAAVRFEVVDGRAVAVTVEAYAGSGVDRFTRP